MTKRKARIVGQALSGGVACIMFADFAVTCFRPDLVRPSMEEAGFPATLARPLGLIELACGVAYAVPSTSCLGAVLVTGFLGGAVCTHFRMGEVGSPPQLISIGIGLMAWGGLWLRDGRVRALLPVAERAARRRSRSATGGRQVGSDGSGR